jgi:nucleoside-diphosphate-sugar epimerase
MIKRMKEGSLILVTGAGGFIGSHVVHSLTATGHQVRAHLGPPGFAPTHPLGSDVETISCPIDDRGAVERMVQGVACVVHLAGPPSVAASFREPGEFARAHVLGTAHVLDACLKHGVTRLVYGSSAEVYGRQPAMPVGEEAPPVPRSPYAAFKLAAEDMARARASSALTAVILRFFSVYGPGMSRHSLIHQVFQQARDTTSVMVHNPAVVRDFIHISDVADAVATACQAPVPEPYLKLNVGSGIGTSVREFAGRVLRLFGKPPRVGSVAEASDRPEDMDIMTLIADRRAIERTFGWRPKLDLEAGLASIAQGLGAMP